MRLCRGFRTGQGAGLAEGFSLLGPCLALNFLAEFGTTRSTVDYLPSTYDGRR
jgi:hypothetical protein